MLDLAEADSLREAEKEIPSASSLENKPATDSSLTQEVMALLEIICELSGRYHPNQLAVSVGIDRVGLTGWMVDKVLGAETDFDEETAKLNIAKLYEKSLVTLTNSRKLQATEKGLRFWQQFKQ